MLHNPTNTLVDCLVWFVFRRVVYVARERACNDERNLDHPPSNRVDHGGRQPPSALPWCLILA